MEQTKAKRLVWLFGVNFVISAFTFGGGYVVIPMIRKYFIQKKALFAEEELLNMAAVAQSSPGAIAINLSALAGYRVAGVPGAVVSCLGAVLPPFLILSVISSCYAWFRSNKLIAAALKGMEAGVAALIVDTVANLCRSIFKEKQPLLTVLVPAAFVANFVLGVNVIIVILSSAALCLAVSWIGRRRRGACGK